MQEAKTRTKKERCEMDVVRKDMQIFGLREDDAWDKERWRTMIHCGD